MSARISDAELLLTTEERIRFESKIRRESETGCWIWTSRIGKNGYGYFHLIRGPRRQSLAHRLAYRLHVGPISEGLVIDHLCRNRACVNPTHLEPVVHAINVARGATATKPTCKNGHPFTPDNTYARVDGHGRRQCRACARVRNAARREAHRRAHPPDPVKSAAGRAAWRNA